MRIVFMGTPEFAVPTLESLINNGYEIAAVVSQPDKAKGRGKKVFPTEVKASAIRLGLTVYQPSNIKDGEFINILEYIKPDLIIVVAFGQLLPKEILDLPRYGCINVHASLLPRLRGAAPINWSIINGDTVTGITTMHMDTGLDTGDIIIQKKVDIYNEDTARDLHDRLSMLGASAMIETIELIEKGNMVRIKQNDEEASYAPILTKDMGRIDWSVDAAKVKNLIRGTYPWPGAYSFYEGTMFKIYDAEAIASDISNSNWGRISEVGKNYFIVECKTGFLKIKEVQFQSKKRMNVGAYLLGNKIEEGKILS